MGKMVVVVVCEMKVEESQEEGAELLLCSWFCFFDNLPPPFTDFLASIYKQKLGFYYALD
jgi:hypothetical protein